MSNRNDLPPATAGNFLARVREELTIMMGNRGTPLDQAVRFKDLQNSSLMRLDSGFLAGQASNRPTIAGPGPAVPLAYAIDLTPPPTPTGFAASAAISNLFVQHDAPLFTMGHGYLRTVLYGASRLSTTAPVPTFANAVQLTQFIGPFAAYPTNPSTIWHLWIKWMTVDGVLSVSPAGGTNGLSVTTGVDVSLLIKSLTGQITASQLFTDLGARINLIDTPGTGLVARLATETTARTNADGTLFAQYSVKVDLNGYVAGFGLSSTANNATPTSAFAVRADQFYIASPSGPGITPTVPFIVRTSATTINGVNVPAGVYMQDAFIANGTITNVKIGNAAIDDAKVANLSASKLTAGSISVGAFISSSNYVSGSQGWRINGSGSAEFSGVVVRGTVYASAGSFSGDISASSGNFRGQITGGAFQLYAFPPAGSGGGFYLGSGGLLLGNANEGKYLQVSSAGDIFAPQFSIINGAATFAGNLSAAGGSFSGTLSANAVNAVNTINIAGEAVVVTASGSANGSNATAEVTLSNTNNGGAVQATATINYVPQGNNGNSTGSLQIRLFRNGAAYASGPASFLSLASGFGYLFTVSSIFKNMPDGVYTATLENGPPASWDTGNNTITVLGIKR